MTSIPVTFLIIADTDINFYYLNEISDQILFSRQ